MSQKQSPRDFLQISHQCNYKQVVEAPREILRDGHRRIGCQKMKELSLSLFLRLKPRPKIYPSVYLKIEDKTEDRWKKFSEKLDAMQSKLT